MMDIVPPSYESATTRDAWSTIAQYIPSSDLCAVALVCRRWHEVFMPFLWGNPASHFGTENDDVYVALTRFRRTLRYARLEVRILTHTLHMPPALSEIYGGPRPEWLREILEYLPCLQSLMVSELPFFDHNAMTALKGAGKFDQPANGSASRTYNVRLLLARREPNTTFQGIAETLLRFTELVYLDLSYTTPARDQVVLSAISQLENLQVLKLRGIGLRDNEAEILANAIGLRVRYLDLRNNKLTDMAVRSLLQACFLPQGASIPGLGGLTDSPSNLKLLGSSTLDERFVKALTCPLTGRSWVEGLPNVGITHLYIADNQITVEGVSSLLSSTRLHVLDVGTVDTAKHISTPKSSLSPSQTHQQVLPGVEKLIPILVTLAKENMTYLRVHFPICTFNAPQMSSASPTGVHELSADTSGVVRFQELDSDSYQIYELPGDENPVFELPGTPVPQTSEGDRPQADGNSLLRSAYQDEQLPSVRRGSVYAPEVLEFQIGPDSPEHTPRGSSPVPMEDPRSSKIKELLGKRPKGYTSSRGNSTEVSIPYLHPSNVPNVETLVLTDVPSHIPDDSTILDSLIRFITACSNEALLAILQAGTDYSLPPGQDRANAEQERARSLFALRQVVLEITPVTQPTGPISSAKWKSVSSQIGPYRSSTGDRDLEELWSAAVDDFSFFDETECGIPENDPGKYFPIAALNEKVPLIPEDDDFGSSWNSNLGTGLSSLPNGHNLRSQPKPSIQEPPPEPQVDLVAELSAFRRRKKLEYEEVVRNSYKRRSTNGSLSPLPRPSTGSIGPLSPSSSLRTPGALSASPQSIPHHVEGHWKGEVKIVRNAAPRGRSGVVDMYGNYFEKGYLYP